MFRKMPLRVVLLSAALVVTASHARAASLTPLASRSLTLPGGGRIEVGTRYHAASYRTGEMLRIDPVLSSDGARGGPEIVSGSVELRPHGFAPCLTDGSDGGPGCVEGTAPTLDPGKSPTTFSFSFVRLFNTTGPDGNASPSWFGYASFIVTLTVRTGGEVQTVRFPLTVTVQQSEMDIQRPEVPRAESTAVLGLHPATYPVYVSYQPPLRDRLTSPLPLDPLE